MLHAEVGQTWESVDPARVLVEVEPKDLIGIVNVQPALDLATIASAAQLLGCAKALLEHAVDYAKQRHQFGKPIGSFQAVKHQLANAAVSIEMARPLLHAAGLSWNSPRSALDSSAARVACAKAAHQSARTALQVHGAIGFTAEHDLSRWLLKARALESAWGTQLAHRQRVLHGLREHLHLSSAI